MSCKDCEWTEISPENLPRVGDELFQKSTGSVIDFDEYYAPYGSAWTHRRPINAPSS